MFLKDPDPPYDKPQKLSPLVRRLTVKNPGPFTYTGTNCWIIGQGQVAVIDPGPAKPGQADHLLTCLEPGEQISHILVSHTHRDHSPGAAELKARTGADIWGFGPHGSGRLGGVDPKASFEGGDWDFNPDRRLTDGDKIEGEGWTITALHMPGHCSNHLCFDLGDSGEIVSADHVMSWATSIVSPPDGDMADYMMQLQRLLEMGPKRLYPGHGVPVDDPEPFIAHLIAHRKAREAKVIEAIASGAETVPMMMAQVYDDVPKQMYPAAARSLLAHLIKLVDDKIIRAKPTATIDAHYCME